MSPKDSHDDSSALESSLLRPQFTAMDMHTSTSTVHDQDRPTHRLPVEILACILNFLFPDPGDSHAGRSKSDMTELYRLRMVSKLWKDLVEGTPTLWTHVSTAYPTAVVQDCLRWSKNHFLRIRVFHPIITSAEALIERLQLIQPHSHRWITLCYSTTGVPDADEAQSRTFLESPAPMLQRIYVNLSAFTSGVEVNLAGGRAKGVKQLTLHDGLLPLSSSLLHGLEELSLIFEGKVPVEEILDILAEIPALRYFELSYEGAEGQNNPIAFVTQSLVTVAASLKEVIIHINHPHIITGILSQISMPSCESVELSADFAALDGDLQTLDLAIAQFMPKIRETLILGRRTILLVSSESDFEWSSPLEHKGFQFSFGISGIAVGRLIEWIRNLSALLEAPLELEISLTTPHRQTLETLGELGEVTKLRIPWMEDYPPYEIDEIPSIPNFLSDVRVDSIGRLSWNFPNLRELDVYSVGYHPLEIFGMLNKRYLPDSYVRTMEGLGISIQTPPQIDLRVKGSIEGGNATIMMALENHRGVTSLNQGGLDKAQSSE